MPHSSKQVKIVNRQETYKLYASGGLQIEDGHVTPGFMCKAELRDRA